MTELPTGWHVATLGDVARWGSGGTPRAGTAAYYGGDIRWAVIGDLNDGIVSKTSGSITDLGLKESSAKLVPRGSVLIAMYGSIGKLGIAGVDLATNQAIAFAIPDPSLDARFLFLYLLSQRRQLGAAGKGATQQNIGQGTLKAWLMPVPPLDEQRRIVEILEDHLSRLDAADAYLTTCGVRARSWHAALVNAAIWPGTSSERPLSSLLREPMRNGHSARASADGRGIRTLTLTAVTRGQFTDEFTKLTVADPQKAAGLWLKSGDILVQRANTAELVGTTRRYDGPDHWAIFPDLLIRVRVDESQVTPHYVAAVMQSEAAHRWLRARAKGLAGSMPKIDQSTIGALPIPTPVLEDQRQVASRVADLSQETQRLSKELRRAQAQGVALRRALLHAAFTGRLTCFASDTSRVEELAARSSASGWLG